MSEEVIAKSSAPRAMSGGLTKRLVRGSAFEFAGYGSAQLTRLISNLVLTRMLFPEAFGLAALVNILNHALAMLSDVGLPSMIIQSEHGDDQRVAGRAPQPLDREDVERRGDGDGVGRQLEHAVGEVGVGERDVPSAGERDASGERVVPRQAPALGLPPEIPGSAAAALADRQRWWAFAAAATAGGLGLLLLSGRRAAQIGRPVLIALPHLVGAPHPGAFVSTAPAELAGHFAAASLVVSALFWALLGSLSGGFHERLAQRG